jgi:hypothetical protein
MEFGQPSANRGPVCALDNCQWCGVPCFAGAAISLDGYLPWEELKVKVKVTVRQTVSQSHDQIFITL